MDTTAPSPASHRVVIPRRGGPEVLSYDTVDAPEPAAGEARIAVEAAGVSAYDTMLRGHRFPGFPRLPYVPGEDVVGIVDTLGAGTSGLSIGQRVGGWTFGRMGGYAEHVCLPANTLVPVPDDLDAAEAVVLIVNYLTAALALQSAAGLQAGESLLVQGAGGGLGSALLQLGREAGLHTYGCDAASKGVQIGRDGAVALDYREADLPAHVRSLTGGGVDAVIDVVGGPSQLFRSYRCLGRGGRLVLLGMAGAHRAGTGIILPSLAVLGVLALWPDGRRVTSGKALDTYSREHIDWYRSSLAYFFRAATDGRLLPHVAARIPMRDAAQAHAMLESGQAEGKIVLVTDRYRARDTTRVRKAIAMPADVT